MVSSATGTSRVEGAVARFRLRHPQVTDGRSVHALIAACAPLDTNSLYLNLLQCTHFAETCVLAEPTDAVEGPVGFVSGYLKPTRPSTLFIWQVAIATSARGCGLARTMILDLLERPVCAQVDHIETTITESNGASWALFRSIARTLDAPLEQQLLFDRDAHLDRVHESEVLVSIGPFLPRNAAGNSPRRKNT
jgi:L-2,4-diaminobutyric acid acetyltransferase